VGPPRGMLAAEGQFCRVKGYQELSQLALALEPCHRRPAGSARPVIGCRCLKVASVMEAPPKSNGERDNLRKLRTWRLRRWP